MTGGFGEVRLVKRGKTAASDSGNPGPSDAPHQTRQQTKLSRKDSDQEDNVICASSDEDEPVKQDDDTAQKKPVEGRKVLSPLIKARSY